MERPQTVLILLVAVGLAISGFFYGANQKGTLAKLHKKELASEKQAFRSEIAKQHKIDLETQEKAGDVAGQARSCGELGRLFLDRGEPAEARETLRRGVSAARKLADNGKAKASPVLSADGRTIFYCESKPALVGYYLTTKSVTK